MAASLSICKTLNGRKLFNQSLANADLATCGRLSRSEIDSCDLSGATLDGLMWSRSRFTSVDFTRASMKGFVDRANKYSNCIFVGSDLTNATLGFEGSEFDSCNFDGANFGRSSFIRPLFVGCTFAGQFRNVDFEASSFSRCRFSGRVDGGWFRNGYQHPDLVSEFGRPPVNSMTNVDFQDAVLWGVGFSGSVDLSSVLLPRDGEHYFFDRWPSRIASVGAQSPNDAQLKSAIEGFVSIFGPSSQRQHQYIVHRGFLAQALSQKGADYILDQLLSAKT